MIRYLFSQIPYRECEHAVKMFKAAFAVLFVRVYYYFGIRIGREPMTFLDQVLFKLREVIDLAVVNDDDRAVLIEHRLMAGGCQVEDGQPAEPKSRIRTKLVAAHAELLVAGVVGPAMDHGVHHAADGRL